MAFEPNDFFTWDLGHGHFQEREMKADRGGPVWNLNGPRGHNLASALIIIITPLIVFMPCITTSFNRVLLLRLRYFAWDQPCNYALQLLMLGFVNQLCCGFVDQKCCPFFSKENDLS
jgi:hypothetical protein